MSVLLGFSLCFIVLIIITINFMNWLEHIQKTKDALALYGYANYKTFLKEFNKYE